MTDSRKRQKRYSEEFKLQAAKLVMLPLKQGCFLSVLSVFIFDLDLRSNAAGGGSSGSRPDSVYGVQS
jgi:hypothetical protein